MSNECAPLFVIGNPRSGTSLLRLILTCHTQILIPPECGFVVWLKDKYSDWNKNDLVNIEKIECFISDLKSSKKFDTWNIDSNQLKKSIFIKKPLTYPALCSIVYEEYGVQQGKSFSIWGDKNNFHTNYLSELLALFGKARFLQIIRDGRDVASSYKQVMSENSNSPYAPNLNTNIIEIANEWVRNIEKFEFFSGFCPKAQLMTVRYEDLVNSPELTVKSICNWLNFNYEEAMLDFFKINIKEQLEPKLTMDWKRRTMTPVSNSTVGRFKSNLSAVEIIKFEEISKTFLLKYGYDVLY